MAKRLPSLNVLNVFEAAARHLSFKQAADELCISPPAVSHQIRVLEKQLGLPLFIRLNRALKLTEEGRVYFEEVRAALLQLQQATNRLMDKHEEAVFRVNSIPYITNSLLIPHIQTFRDAHPELRIDIKSQTLRTDFSLGETDVAIRHQKGDEPELHYEELSKVLISPVCSPAYLADYQRAESSNKLQKHRLIRLSIDQHSWPYWLESWQQELLPEDELNLDNYQAVLAAVKQGLGLAMGYLPSLLPDIKKGELVLPFPEKVSEFSRVYLVYLKADKEKASVQSFQLWIKKLIQTLWSDKKILPEGP